MAKLDSKTAVEIELELRMMRAECFRGVESRPILEVVADRKVDKPLHGRELRSLSELRSAEGRWLEGSKEKGTIE